MITDEVYVEIELLRRHGLSLRKIAEEVGCAVNTVRSHLEAHLGVTASPQAPFLVLSASTLWWIAFLLPHPAMKHLALIPISFEISALAMRG